MNLAGFMFRGGGGLKVIRLATLNPDPKPYAAQSYKAFSGFRVWDPKRRFVFASDGN